VVRLTGFVEYLKGNTWHKDFTRKIIAIQLANYYSSYAVNKDKLSKSLLFQPKFSLKKKEKKKEDLE